MRKLLCGLLAVSMLLALCGCRSRAERQAMRAQLDYANGYTQPERTDWAMDDGTTLEEQVLLEQEDGLTVTAVGLYEDRYDVNLVLRVRNDGKEDVRVSCESLAVNGWSLYGYLSGMVYAGGMADLELGISQSDLYRAGIDVIWEIRLVLDLYDENYNTLAEPEAVLTTSNPPQETEPDGVLCYEDELLAVYLLDVAADEWSVQVYLALENRGTQELTIESGYAALDGDEDRTVDFWLWEDLPAGGRLMTSNTLWREDLEELTGSDAIPETLTVALTVSEEYGGAQTVELILPLTES